MNKSLLVIVAITIFTLGIGLYINSRKPSQTDSMNDKMVMDSKKMTSIKYVEYDNPTFEKASNNRRVLFFYASWCPTCKPADASFRQNENKIPDDVVLIRVNYNDPETDQDENNLANKYGITYQHTFVQIDSEGGEIAKWNGGGIEELLSNIK